MHLLILAAIQGVTEFLPVSSSGHLALASPLFGWPDQGRVIDVAVHVGTLGAVLVYTIRDIWQILGSLVRGSGGQRDPGRRLAFHIVVASLPVIVCGYLVSRYLGDMFRTLEVIAWATIGFAIVLWVADRYGMTIRRIKDMIWGDALLIGLVQVCALIPGASRAGMTMAAARLMGFERLAAARFSLLLGIPAIAGAGVLEGWDLYQQGDIALTIDVAIAAGAAFGFALISIFAMMTWLRYAGFTPFVVYRILLGGALLAWIYL